VNSNKTLATGARHKTCPKDPYNATLLKQVLEHTTVQGAPATFHDPKHPFRYLGVQFTMNLNLESPLSTYPQNSSRHYHPPL
jgi:hypothetical protein